MVIAPGSRFDRYEIISPLGRGGMGEVYLAVDPHLRRKVALKLLLVQFMTDANRVRRFEQEAQAASALNHPNIMTIHEIGQVDGSYFIATEFIEGQTLRYHLTGSRMEPLQALDIAIQVASALVAAHEAGIIHRDIKPENIMLRPDGLVKVLDFGLAKLTEHPTTSVDTQAPTEIKAQTEPGMVMGTPQYMSPEQARGVRVDARTDIFSVGTVLYEMIAGYAPFTGATMSDVIAALLKTEPLPLAHYSPGIPAELERIVSKSLTKDREERYQTIKDLFLDLKRLKQRLEFEAELERSRRPEESGYVTTIMSGRQETVETVPKTGDIPSPAIRTIPSGRWRQPRVIIPVMLVVLAMALHALPVILSKLRATPYRPSPEARYWYEQGTNALRDGTYYKASKALERAIQIDDKFALAHARLAEALTELDYADKAKDEIIRAETLVPNHSSLSPQEALYLQAITYTVLRRFASAIESYHEIVRHAAGEEKARVYLDLGRAYEKGDQLDKAKEHYLEASRLAPQDAVAFLRLGTLYSEQQAVEAALEAFQKAETLYQALSNLEGLTEVRYQRGLLFNHLGKLSEARVQLEQALEMAQTTDSKHQQIKTLLQLARASHLGGKTTLAKQYATQAIDLAQANEMETLSTEGLVNLGNAFFTHGAYTEAENYFKQALEFARRQKGRRGEAMAQLALGAFYIHLHNADEGLRYVEQALTFYQKGGYRREAARALRRRGNAFALKGDYTGALGIYEEQLQLAEQVGDVSLVALSHADIATALADQGRYPEALHHFDQGLAISESLGNEFVSGTRLIDRGDMLWRLGRYEEARAALDKASSIAERPDDKNEYMRARIPLVRALLALSARQFRDAETAGRQALSLNAENEHAIVAKSTLGLARALSGAKQEGRRWCEEAVEMARHAHYSRLRPEALLALAEALLESGDAPGARHNALQAQESFSRAGQQELEWRAWLLAGRACQRAGDQLTARDYALRAEASLSSLKKMWGIEASSGYLTRPDIQESLRHLRQLMAENQ